MTAKNDYVLSASTLRFENTAIIHVITCERGTATHTPYMPIIGDNTNNNAKSSTGSA